MMPLVAPALKPTRDVAMSDTRFALITSLVLILSYIVAMSVSSLERVLAYVGSTGSTSISLYVDTTNLLSTLLLWCSY